MKEKWQHLGKNVKHARGKEAHWNFASDNNREKLHNEIVLLNQDSQ